MREEINSDHINTLKNLIDKLSDEKVTTETLDADAEISTKRLV